MAEEGLEGTDVGAALEEVGSERMAESMTGGTFGDGRFADGIGELSLEGVFMEVITSVVAGPRMRAEFGGREDELPGPFTRGVWVFTGEGGVHVDLSDAGDEVEAVFFSIGGEVGLAARFEGLGERDEAEEEDESVELLFLGGGGDLAFEGEEMNEAVMGWDSRSRVRWEGGKSRA